MLLDLVCYHCVIDQLNNGVPDEKAGEPIMTPLNEVNNTGIYEVNCDQGHTSKTVLNNIDFEILFEYGLNAIVDGYYRESVSTITASLERYFEFFIKVILTHSKVQNEEIEKTMKLVSNQSERQLGAYIFLYCQTFGEKPPLLNPNKEVKFRNKVTHKGYIPTKEESIKYADKVLELMEDSLIKLKNKFPEATKTTFENFGYRKTAEEQLKKKSEEDFVTVNIMTTIDVIHGREINKKDGRKGNVEKRIEVIKERRTPRILKLLPKDN